MKQINIPKSFLRLPKIESIGLNPSQDYQYNMQGQIHSQQFLDLVRLFTDNPREDWNKYIVRTLQSHAIVDALAILSNSQILDFLIHILYANSQIDWNTISSFENYLAKEMDHVSRWELPDLDFTQDLGRFYSTLVTIELSETVLHKIEALKKILHKSFASSQVERIINTNLLSNIKKGEMINLSKYFELIMNISVIQHTGLVMFEELPELMSGLTSSWHELENQLMFDEFDQKILFNIHSIQLNLNDTPEALKTCQNLLNATISDLCGLSKSKQKSYVWLIDSIKAQIVNQVTKYKMELVTEDLFLRSIGDRFLNPENTDLKNWMYAIETSDLPIWIITLILKGYLAVEAVLHRYYSELPISNNDNLATINNCVMSLLKTFDSNYITQEKAPYQHFSFHQEFNLLNSWVQAGFNQIKITPRNQFTHEPVIFDRIEDSIFGEYHETYRLICRILLGEYEFDIYLERIKNYKMDGDFHQLIGNQEFADIFLDKFARLFGYAQNQQINGGDYPIEKYREMIFFLHSWLPYLLKIEDLVYSTLTIFLSFYHVVINMIEIYYSLKNKHQHAKVWDLNYKLFELNLYFSYGYPELNNISDMLRKESLFDNFYKILGKFKVKYKISKFNSRYLTLDSIYDVSQFKINQDVPGIKPEKLNEDKIMEYLNLQDRFQSYLGDLRTSDLTSMKDKLLNNPFSKRNPALSLFDNLSFEEGSELRFPIIQPINAYAAAISFFDLDIDFSTSEIIEEEK